MNLWDVSLPPNIDGCTSFIGFDDGLSFPVGGEIITTIIILFFYVVFSAGLTAIQTATTITIEFKDVSTSTTPATLTIIEVIEDTFECRLESSNEIFFATINSDVKKNAEM